jgi:hypothetical protein
MTKRYFSASATEAQLISGVNEAAVTITLNLTTGYPATKPFIIVVGNGTSSEEVMLVTATAGSTFTVTRAYDSTTAKAHATGSSVIHAASAIDFREANTFINSAKTWGNLKDGS